MVGRLMDDELGNRGSGLQRYSFRLAFGGLRSFRHHLLANAGTVLRNTQLFPSHILCSSLPAVIL
jgi:hypothetical protein